MLWILPMIALIAGAANPLQAAANAELNRQLGTPLWAGLSVYASGLLGMLLLLLLSREPAPASATLAGVHAWVWFGGLISIASTVAGLLLAQRLGAGIFTGLTVTASLVTSLVLDHFGLLGFRQHTASPGRLAGGVLLIAGAWMLARF